tara:strand:+ start:177 stop:446 length:270 start_codon:yes stop_codon:yes gene_type:complete
MITLICTRGNVERIVSTTGPVDKATATDVVTFVADGQHYCVSSAARDGAEGHYESIQVFGASGAHLQTVSIAQRPAVEPPQEEEGQADG